MAWHHYQLVMLARMVLDLRYHGRADVEVRIIALQQRLGLEREQVWSRTRRLAGG